MLELITSNALAPRHGFFTRKGGASSGIFAGLNCGTGSSDQADIVAINQSSTQVAYAADALFDRALVYLIRHSATSTLSRTGARFL